MALGIRSPLARLADHLLDEGLEAFLKAALAEDLTLRVIARDLWARTSGEVDTTAQTINDWLAALGLKAKDSAA